MGGAVVLLNGRVAQPVVHGEMKPLLSEAEYDVVAALLEGGPGGLSMKKLDRRSGHTDARKILRRLRGRDRDWEAAIHMAGRRDGRYRIEWAPDPAHNQDE